MNTVEDIVDADNSITILVKSLFESSPSFLQSSIYPNTTKLLFNLTKRIDSIKEGVFTTVLSDNYYSTQVLLRVLIEHYLTYMYVNERLKNESNDNIGTEYYMERGAEESIDFWDASNKVLKMMNEDAAAIELNRVIYEERFTELKKINKKDLIKKNKQYKVKEMIKYFLKDIDFKILDYDTEVPALSNLRYYKDWVQLSSFVHCGPLAEKMTLINLDNEKRNERLINIAEFTFKISSGIKCLCLTHFTSITKDFDYLLLSLEITEISNKIKIGQN